MKKIIITLILICALTPVFGCKKPNKSDNFMDNGKRLVFVEKTAGKITAAINAKNIKDLFKK